MKSTHRILQIMFSATVIILFISATTLTRDANDISMIGNDELKTERLVVNIYCLNCSNGTGTLIAYNPEEINIQYYSGSNYEVLWYSGKGELLATNTNQIQAVCGRKYIAVVTEHSSERSGSARHESSSCRDREGISYETDNG